jgi:hypothetical protein
MRCAIVGSGTRNARAISAVVKPRRRWRKRHAGFRRKHRMAGNKKQAKQVVAEILLVGSVEFGFKICHGGFLLGVEFAAELLVFALESLLRRK